MLASSISGVQAASGHHQGHEMHRPVSDLLHLVRVISIAGTSRCCRGTSLTHAAACQKLWRIEHFRAHWVPTIPIGCRGA